MAIADLVCRSLKGQAAYFRRLRLPPLYLRLRCDRGVTTIMVGSHHLQLPLRSRLFAPCRVPLNEFCHISSLGGHQLNPFSFARDASFMQPSPLTATVPTVSIRPPWTPHPTLVAVDGPSTECLSKLTSFLGLTQCPGPGPSTPRTVSSFPRPPPARMAVCLANSVSEHRLVKFRCWPVG